VPSTPRRSDNGGTTQYEKTRARPPWDGLFWLLGRGTASREWRMARKSYEFDIRNGRRRP
jgi:hypothetical protein